MVVKERRQTGLGRLKQAGICALAHIITVTDSVEHTFAFLECKGCQDMIVCRKFAKLVEKELNI